MTETDSNEELGDACNWSEITDARPPCLDAEPAGPRLRLCSEPIPAPELRRGHEQRRNQRHHVEQAAPSEQRRRRGGAEAWRERRKHGVEERLGRQGASRHV